MRTSATVSAICFRPPREPMALPMAPRSLPTLLAAGVGVVEWAVGGVGVEVGTAAGEADRVLADEAVQGRAVVAGTVVVERAVAFTAGVLAVVCAGGAGCVGVPEGVVRVGGGERAAGVGERDRAA